MEDFENTYLLAFDEINKLDFTNTDKESMQDEVLTKLVEAYVLGVRTTSEMLDYDLEIDLDMMEDAIFMRFEGITFEERIRKHIDNNDPSGLKKLAESEFHRVFCNAGQDAAEQYVKKTKNSCTKTWNTKLDLRVRDTHNYLEQMTVPYNSEFFTYDGDHALFPGMFIKVENNANCRCLVTYKRW